MGAVQFRPPKKQGIILTLYNRPSTLQNKNPLHGFDPAIHELYPKPNCVKCFGRGWIGKNLTFKEYAECSCLRYRDKASTNPEEAIIESISSPPEPDTGVCEVTAETNETDSV